MKLRYGNWTSASGEVTLTTRRTPVFSDGGLQVGVKELWAIQGTVLASGPAALLAALAPIEAAFSAHYQSIALLTDAGQVVRQMQGVTPLGGTRVIEGVSYPASGENDSEWATKREWAVQVEGTYQVAQIPASTIYTFTETIRQRGGGPRRAMLEAAVGPPQSQITRQQTAREITQQGTATGISPFLAVPPPLFGAAALWEQPEITRSARQPTQVPGTAALLPNYEVAWSYLFRFGANVTAGVPSYW